jgi:hypothetical protein
MNEAVLSHLVSVLIHWQSGFNFIWLCVFTVLLFRLWSNRQVNSNSSRNTAIK